jgi:hypothetical protein
MYTICTYTIMRGKLSDLYKWALREYINMKERNLENTIRRVIREELKELSR